jgi:enediyne polyketide synthase
LLSLLGADGISGRLAVHGRLGTRAPRPIALAGAAAGLAGGRFTERVLVHYPGVELVAEADLDACSDPYLTDYVIDGACVLPPAIAIEAMAQAASALAGAPMRDAVDVSMTAPVVLSGRQPAAVLRLCALTAGDAVSVVLRCEDTGFTVDHFRATFGQAADGVAESGSPAPRATGAVRADDLYGPVCFQAGRFRRLSEVRLAGCGAATGLLDDASQQSWFAASASATPCPPAQLVLGSPAIADAAMQVVQACVPHRRLMFAGCASATFAGPGPTRAVQLRAAQVSRGAGTALVPRQRTPDHAGQPPVTVWDVDAVDADGQAVAAFRGLVMRDAGPLPRTSPWPAALAGCLIERAAAALGLGPGLQVRVDRRLATPSQRGSDGWVRASAADSGLPGLVLRVRAAEQRAACGWRAVKPSGRRFGGAELAERWLALLGDQESTANRARAVALAACAGPDVDPRDLAVEVRPLAGMDWLLVRAGSASLTCAVIDVAGITHPVAVAVMTGVMERSLAAQGSS